MKKKEPSSSSDPRGTSYGQAYRFTFIDKFGVYLSNKKIVDFVKKYKPKRIIDIGCGYHAMTLQQLKPYCKDLTGVDIDTDPKIKGIKFVHERLDDNLKFLKSNSADLVIMNNVLEHLRKPQAIVDEIYRVLDQDGWYFNVVPNWRGRVTLEFAAFRLGLAPVEEMNDHVTYYDIRDVYPMLFRAGFLPINMKLGYHKFFLSTISYAKK
jgi:SAM-dependent methyltransferase